MTTIIKNDNDNYNDNYDNDNDNGNDIYNNIDNNICKYTFWPADNAAVWKV